MRKRIARLLRLAANRVDPEASRIRQGWIVPVTTVPTGTTVTDTRITWQS
jgi:hypothetical protein